MKRFLLLALLPSVFVAQHAPTSDSLRTIETQGVSIIGVQSKSIGGSSARISTAELQKLNQPDINKVLRILPGIQVRDEEGFGLRPNIGMRGTPVNRSAKITVMEDGILNWIKNVTLELYRSAGTTNGIHYIVLLKNYIYQFITLKI